MSLINEFVMWVPIQLVLVIGAVIGVGLTLIAYLLASREIKEPDPNEKE